MRRINPPQFVKSARDERLWAEAKRQVARGYPSVEKGSNRYWSLVNGIFQRMKHRVGGRQLNPRASEGMYPSDFDQDALMKGIHREMDEHDLDIDAAMVIAMDHLAEDPRHYDDIESPVEEAPGYETEEEAYNTLFASAYEDVLKFWQRNQDPKELELYVIDIYRRGVKAGDYDKAQLAGAEQAAAYVLGRPVRSGRGAFGKGKHFGEKRRRENPRKARPQLPGYQRVDPLLASTSPVGRIIQHLDPSASIYTVPTKRQMQKAAQRTPTAAELRKIKRGMWGPQQSLIDELVEVALYILENENLQGREFWKKVQGVHSRGGLEAYKQYLLRQSIEAVCEHCGTHSIGNKFCQLCGGVLPQPNPPPLLKRNRDAYVKFHGAEPRSVTEKTVWVPGPLVHLGPAVDIGYLPPGNSKKGQHHYVHDHAKGVKVYARPDAAPAKGRQPSLHLKSFPRELWVLGTNIGFTYKDKSTGEVHEIKGSSRKKLATDSGGKRLYVIDGKGVLFVVKGGNLKVTDWIRN